jgi:hypothetical protein
MERRSKANGGYDDDGPRRIASPGEEGPGERRAAAVAEGGQAAEAAQGGEAAAGAEGVSPVCKPSCRARRGIRAPRPPGRIPRQARNDGASGRPRPPWTFADTPESRVPPGADAADGRGTCLAPPREVGPLLVPAGCGGWTREGGQPVGKRATRSPAPASGARRQGPRPGAMNRAPTRMEGGAARGDAGQSATSARRGGDGAGAGDRSGARR